MSQSNATAKRMTEPVARSSFSQTPGVSPMATTTLLNAVSANTTGSGSAITGDFEVLAQGTHYGGGEVELQVADTDTAADYRPVGIECRWTGPGSPKTVRNNGTKYFRGVLKNVSAAMIKSLGSNPSATLKIIQER